MVKALMTTPLLKLRQQWFKLKTKEFIARNSAGLMVLVIFLPGVAVGDNFKMLMSALSHPFLSLASLETSFTQKILWLVVLVLVFSVWSRAQKQAITGGAFMQYMRCLPLNSKRKNWDDLNLLMRGNHFLWVVIIASAYFLSQLPTLSLLIVFNYLFLLLLLFITQYSAVFKASNKAIITLVVIALLFALPLQAPLAWLRLIILTLVLYFTLINLILKNDYKIAKTNEKAQQFHPKVLNQNLYYQMLFKATLTSTLFRFGIIAGFAILLLLLAKHFIAVSNNKLLPYAFVLEALLAYFLSGFYIVFSDERKGMSHLFASLPVKKLFWFKQDVFVVLLMTTLLHAVYFIWISHFFVLKSLVGLFVFNILLLLVCFPLRLKVKKNQTFISFVVLFIITAITLYNLS